MRLLSLLLLPNVTKLSLQSFLSLYVILVLIKSTVLIDGRRVIPALHIAESHGDTVSYNRFGQELRNITDATMFVARQISNYDISHSSIGIEKEDHRVNHLPGLSVPFTSNIYAGLIQLDKFREKNIFYWLFEAKNNKETAPLIIWLNGGKNNICSYAYSVVQICITIYHHNDLLIHVYYELRDIGPGCSSNDGLFLELGPLRFSDENTLIINEHSWHENANLLFIDQPVGTGLSFTKKKEFYPTSDDMVNEQFYTFLVEFFTIHADLIGRPVYMAGESHAGHYIPSMALHIRKKNVEFNNKPESVQKKGGMFINIKGIALGNPWFDPTNQYDVSDFAHGLGIISIGQKNTLMEKSKRCSNLIKSGMYRNTVCFDLLDDVISSSSIEGNSKVSMYDARKYYLSSNTFPPGHEVVEKYLNRKDVRQAIHAVDTPHQYKECSDPPYYALSHQDGLGVTQELVHLLNDQVHVLIYSGQYDIICNHVSTEAAINKLSWIHQDAWLKSQRGIWINNRSPAGYIKEYENLQFITLLNSGHMVPMDLPQISLDMINMFIRNQSLLTGRSRIVESATPIDNCIDSNSDSTSSGIGGISHEEGAYAYNRYEVEVMLLVGLLLAVYYLCRRSSIFILNIYGLLH